MVNPEDNIKNSHDSNQALTDVAKKSGIVLAGQIIGYGLEFVYALMITRMLGVTEFGRFVYLMSIVSLIVIICKIGLDNGLMYMIPKLMVDKREQDRNRLVSTALVGSVVLAVIFATLLVLFSRFIAAKFLNNVGLQGSLMLLSPMTIPFVLTQISKGILRGVHDIKYYVIGDYIIQISCKIPVVFTLIFFGLKFEAIVFSTYFAICAECLFFIYKFYRMGLLVKIDSAGFKLLTETLAYSYPLLLSGLVILVLHRTDTYMIGYMLNEKQVGIYNIALRVGTMSSFMLVAVNTVFAPMVSAFYHQQQIDTIKNIFSNTTKWVAALNLLIFSIILTCSREIMMVFGRELDTGAAALILVAAGQVVNAGTGSVGLLNTMTGKPKLALYLNVVSLIVNVALNYLLIPKYGINGAAFATLVSVILVNILRLIIVYRDLRIHPYDWSYCKLLPATVISFLVSLGLKSTLQLNYFVELLLVALLVTITFLLIYFLGGLSQIEREMIKKAKKKFMSQRDD